MGSDQGQQAAVLQFDREQERWPTDAIASASDALTPGAPSEELRRSFPLAEVKNAAGTIRTDVEWRDYRLVLQADALAVFCPVMNNRAELARGVRNEIEYASILGKPVYVFQDPDEDKNNTFQKWVPEPGSMGESPIQRPVTVCDSVADVLSRAAEGSS